MSSFNNLGQFLGQFGVFFIAAYWVLIVILHVALAAAVYQDASRRQDQGTSVHLAPLAIWVLATLLGGLLPAFAYWVVNASTLRSTGPSE
jgi:hypothetical protein